MTTVMVKMVVVALLGVAPVERKNWVSGPKLASVLVPPQALRCSEAWLRWH